MPPHYKKHILLSIVERRLPSGAEAWKLVAQDYQKESGDVSVRDYEDIKRHFFERLCNKDQKPTGKSGDEKDFILQAQKVKLKILQAHEVGTIGNNDDEEEDDDDDEEFINEDDRINARDDIDDLFDAAPERVTSQKKRNSSDDPISSSKKTKNSRHSPRVTASHGIDKIAGAMESLSANAQQQILWK